MKSPSQSNDESFEDYISSIEIGKLWEAYFFISESIENLPRISSYKMMFIILHSFQQKEITLYEYTKVALNLQKKIKKELENRNAN